MTIAFDAVTTNNFTGDLTLPHTPAGTPRGVLFLCAQNTASDQIATVTYGAVSMAEVTGSPVIGSAGDEPMIVYGYFLGAGIPAGVQDLVVDTTGTAAKSGVVVTMTAAADTEVDATAIQDAVEDDPTLQLNTTASTNTFVMAVLASGSNGLTDVTPDAAYTQLFESSQSGLRVMNHMRRTTNPTGGAVTVNWTTAAAEDAYILAVAIREAGGGGAVVLDPFGMTGFFGS